MNKTISTVRNLVAATLFASAFGAYAAGEVLRLAPSEYNIFMFNNGSGRIVLTGPVADHLNDPSTFACNTSLKGIAFAAPPEMSNRAIANLLTAKAAGADIFLQVTDALAETPQDNCGFQGSTYIGIE